MLLSQPTEVGLIRSEVIESLMVTLFIIKHHVVADFKLGFTGPLL